MERTVCELFAGVGGFRLGLQRDSLDWKTVWFSQWEPGAAHQYAHDCYVAHFGDIDESTGIDISLVPKSSIPSHALLVGGFPCQDYSVANSLSTSKGIEGKKGVLWWQIRDTLIEKHPPFCIFENVDRLLKSPAHQRGRDFGIILSCLSALDYSVEWRVVNAADYGCPQRRRRTFIFAYKNDSSYGLSSYHSFSTSQIISESGLMAKSFPVESISPVAKVSIPRDVVETSDTFAFEFGNAGYMSHGIAYTANVTPKLWDAMPLKSILVSNADDRYTISPEKMDKWSYLKGAKRINRVSSSGHEYVFSEGAIAFPDDPELPGRTMLTSESTLNRSSHVVVDPGTGKYRVLTPVEAERLNVFDDGWTDTGMPERIRYFCMGNALVVPMITRMAQILGPIIDNE